ncbi:Cell cycle control protein 50A [Scheffersomyces spartinae]|uniref:Cell cycle control protein 50A n=1 Tax=Scheffersomyces spartinae TaxID=45513 RepID=A0A9P7V660_9ASCO|nr:Cell cycle control protein 50A [Scheffersomyces spartinae]KAG7192003.1 Cell cycle control protein 50A [Scheffersomyces spartinae]
MNFLRRRKNSSEDEDDDEFLNVTAAKNTRTKSRKPPNTAFRQQRLKAWQPILTPKLVIPLLLLVAIIFAPLGTVITQTQYNVEIIQIDYSKCESLANTEDYRSVPKSKVYYHFKGKSTDPNVKWKLINSTSHRGDEGLRCLLQFDLPKDIKPPLYLYYRLTNFYQNHRKYVQSVDLPQLKGEAVSPESLTTNCKPLRSITDDQGNEKAIYPCGLIANSMFNDTFENPVLLNPKLSDNNETYTFSQSDISWSSDKTKYKKTTYNVDDIVPPPNWAKQFPNGYTTDNLPDLNNWEHFQNWMRTAGLPNFYKLYGKNTTSTLSSGTYLMNINLNYPVSVFGGTKSVVITTSSIFGGRNVSLGIIFIIVAVVSLVMLIGFFLQHLIRPRRVGDHNFLQGSAFTAVRDQL